jgi:hypothetical protein
MWRAIVCILCGSDKLKPLAILKAVKFSRDRQRRVTPSLTPYGVKVSGLLREIKPSEPASFIDMRHPAE